MAYDSAVISYTTKTDKVDLVQAAHMNAVQSELVTIETILGTNVKGNRSDLKTRLNNALDADGSLLSGTSFPSPALPSQMFFRTDLGLLYLFNSAWGVVGGGLSNVIFQWNGFDGAVNNVVALFNSVNTGEETSSAGLMNTYFGVYGSEYRTILVGKFIKITGVSTITINARLWSDNPDAGYEAILSVNVGGQSNTVKSVTAGSPAWVTASTIDVSSLTNGTTYDITIQLKNESSEDAYCSAVLLTGS